MRADHIAHQWQGNPGHAGQDRAVRRAGYLRPALGCHLGKVFRKGMRNPDREKEDEMFNFDTPAAPAGGR
jgi:hypothetical protein